MQIQEQVTGDVGVLRLSGRLTVNDQPGRVKEAVEELVQRGIRNVIVDLGGVQYVDSTRLGELIAARTLLERRSGRLVLTATPRRVVNLLVLSNLSRVFEQFESVEAARSAFSSAPA